METLQINSKNAKNQESCQVYLLMYELFVYEFCYVLYYLI